MMTVEGRTVLSIHKKHAEQDVWTQGRFDALGRLNTGYLDASCVKKIYITAYNTIQNQIV